MRNGEPSPVDPDATPIAPGRVAEQPDLVPAN